MSQFDDKKPIPKQPWLEQAVDDLRRPVPSEVAGQLRAARRTALEHSKQAPYSKWEFFTGWQAAVAAGCGAIVIGLMFLFNTQTQPVDDGPVTVVKKQNTRMILEDLSIMSGQDDLQFYQDLELLQWLEKEGNLDTQS